MPRLVSLVALFLLSALGAVGQKPVVPSLGETVEVEITNLDVVVTDRDGIRVEAYQRGDLSYEVELQVDPDADRVAIGVMDQVGKTYGVTPLSLESPKIGPNRQSDR